MNQAPRAAETQRRRYQLQAPGEQPSLRGQVSDAEWRLRCDLAAVYRLVAHFGWDDLVFTHISARCTDAAGPPTFLMNPFGLFFHEITASSLIKIDINGQKVAPSPYPANPAGFTIHSAVHAARADAHCVLHVHTEYGMAVSASRDGLRPLTQHSMIVLSDIAYHDYEGIALNHDERERLVADLGVKNALILRNHGTLTTGRTCAEAFLRMFFLEKACKAQILAQSAGPVRECGDTISALVAHQASADFTEEGATELMWAGLLRLIERANPGYDA